MIKDSIPEMVTINTAADRTGLSRYYVRQLCTSGKIVYIKSGVKYMINFQKLCDFLNREEHDPDE